MLKYDKCYVEDRHMVNPPWVRFGGVRAKCVLGAGSLILRPITFLPVAFLALGGGGGGERVTPYFSEGTKTLEINCLN
jgi:hypothetical protein